MSDQVDVAGFEPFYRAEWGRTVGLAYLLVGDATAAAEIAQEAMAVALARWSDVRDPTLFVKGVVRNLARRAVRESVRSAQHLASATVRAADAEDDAAVRVLDITNALSILDPRHREVVVLRYYADLSESQIAELLGCRPGTVKSRLSRALDRLRRELP